jgi:V/A-type H+-transporting ATPase subunit C
MNLIPRSRALVWGYSNARAKAMRPGLLPKQSQLEMLDAQSVDGIVGLLERSAYREDLGALGLKFRGADLIELAAGRNFARTAAKLLKISPEDGRPILSSILSRFDLQNLKAILLAKKLGKDFATVEPYLVPAGSIPIERLKRIYGRADIGEMLLDMRATAIGKAFMESNILSSAEMKRIAADALRDANTLELLMAGLDSYYYAAVGKSVKSTDRDSAVIASLVRAEADGKNIMTIMRCKKNNIDPKAAKSFIISGGTLTKMELRGMLEAANVDEIAEKAASRFGLADAAAEYKKDGMLSHFEVAFERATAERGVRALHQSIMSVGALVGLLFLKEEEMNNIRKIVRGRALGVPREEIAKMLVFPR